MKCRLPLYVTVLLLLLPLTSHSAEGGDESVVPWRVLLVYSYGRDFAPFDAVATEFRTELPKRAAHPIEFYEVSLDTARQAASWSGWPRALSRPRRSPSGAGSVAARRCTTSWTPGPGGPRTGRGAR